MELSYIESEFLAAEQRSIDVLLSLDYSFLDQISDENVDDVVLNDTFYLTFSV